MRINAINNQGYKQSFGDALSTKQERQYKKFLSDVKNEQGFDGGLNIVKIYAPSIPSNSDEDTGIGKVTSKEAEKIYDIAKTYYNATGVKIMPVGPLTDKQAYNDKHYAGAYNRGSFSIGEDVINLFDLTEEKFGNILEKEDAEEFVKKHKTLSDNENIVDFETTLGWENEENYPINEPLKKAFKNFKEIEEPNEELKTLRKEFEEFKTQKEPVDYDDIYTRLALFPYMKDYKAEVDFFVNFDYDEYTRRLKMPEYNRLKEQYKDEIEFYKFKQFLGHKTLQNAKKTVNDKGMDFIGDCSFSFSWPETQMFPDAFLENGEVGWGIPAINFYELQNRDDAPTNRLLRAKVGHFLLNYDGIRFDVGWQYMNPKIIYKNGRIEHFDLGTKITDDIEKTAKEIKGEDFDLRKLMYECDADFSDFGLQKQEIQDKIRKINGLAIISTEAEHNEGGGWANLAYVRDDLKLGQDDTINGTNTHDGKGMYECATDSEISGKQIGGILRTFNLREEDGVKEGWRLLKDDSSFREHAKKYFRARFAEIATCKNTFIQLFDMLGRKEKVDYHTGGNPQLYGHDLDYKNRLEGSFEENFHKAIKNKTAYNAADAHKFRMEHDGTKDRRPDLYERASRWAAYLEHDSGINTKEQADKSDRANLDIENMTVDEIKNLDITT